MKHNYIDNRLETKFLQWNYSLPAIKSIEDNWEEIYTSPEGTIPVLDSYKFISGLRVFLSEICRETTKVFRVRHSSGILVSCNSNVVVSGFR